MIEVKNLTKKYGNKTVLDDVSFDVRQGEILGFLGPNGAGKSTTMNIITGYLSLTEGEVLVDGDDVLEKPQQTKKKIGYLPEIPPLYPDMTVKEYLDFVYDLKKVKDSDKNAHLAEVMNRVMIDNVKDRLIRNLSKGYKQRVGLAQAIIGKPPILILDEPTVGLDPQQIIDIRNMIKELGKESTVILSSHILPEVSAVCDRVLILNKGKIVAEDTPDRLKGALADNERLTLSILGDKSKIERLLQNGEGVVSIKDLGSSGENTYDYQIELKRNGDCRKNLLVKIAGEGLAVVSMKEEDMSLEDIFLSVVKEAEHESDL